MLMEPTGYSHAELDYDYVVGADTVVTPSFDPHCANGEVSGGCKPVAVISTEKLRDYTEGPAETAKIANVLHNDDRTGQFVIAQEAWDCIWDELIPRGKGLRPIVYDRPDYVESYTGFVESDTNFSAEMLEEMIHELDRVISKYSGPDWNTKETANRIVQLIVEHRALIQTELNEVNSGMRKLTDRDFLGPKERERRRRLKLQEAGETITTPQDHSKYFNAIDKKMQEKKRLEMRQMARRTQSEQEMQETEEEKHRELKRMARRVEREQERQVARRAERQRERLAARRADREAGAVP